MKSNRLFPAIKNTFFIMAAVWGGFLLQAMPFFNTTAWGIVPRYSESWKGIFTSPLMHGGWDHIISNSAPMIVLLLMLFYFYRKIAWASLILIWVLTGSAEMCIRDRFIFWYGRCSSVDPKQRLYPSYT